MRILSTREHAYYQYSCTFDTSEQVNKGIISTDVHVNSQYL